MLTLELVEFLLTLLVRCMSYSSHSTTTEPTNTFAFNITLSASSILYIMLCNVVYILT